MTTAHPNPSNAAFERFRAMTKKVLSVPKAEADARAKLMPAQKPGPKAKS